MYTNYITDYNFENLNKKDYYNVINQIKIFIKYVIGRSYFIFYYEYNCNHMEIIFIKMLEILTVLLKYLLVNVVLLIEKFAPISQFHFCGKSQNVKRHGVIMLRDTLKSLNCNIKYFELV